MTDNVRKNLDELCGTIAAEAKHADTDFKDKVDAFKALTTYYALLRRHPDASAEDDDGFDFTKDIHANGTAVRS